MIPTQLKNKTLFIDLDGTMYHGSKVIPEALIFIQYLIQNHIPFYFLTNNATKTQKQNLDKMLGMGFKDIQADQFFTSAIASAAYLRRNYSDTNAFWIGEEGLTQAMKQYGFTYAKQANIVVIGLSFHASYEDYQNAFYNIQKGAKLYGTNPDRKLPHGNDYLIGNGAILNMLEYASGIKCTFIGKPYVHMMEEMLYYSKIEKKDCLIIGDNLETDIRFALEHDLDHIFVSSGVHTMNDAKRLNIYPNYHIHQLTDLIHP